MNVEYDKYYQTEKLFGEPYPELINFYAEIKNKGKLLDLGCGQGRDAIALAKKLGYSKVSEEKLACNFTYRTNLGLYFSYTSSSTEMTSFSISLFITGSTFFLSRILEIITICLTD